MMNKNNNGFSKRYNLKWTFGITIITFLMAMIFSIVTENLVKNLDVFLAFIILIITISIGIVFDVIGIAVATGDEKPFHSMAANRVEGAKYAIRLVRNAGQVSNFCNDVVGDISGIISGVIGAMIIFKLISTNSIANSMMLSIILTSLIASITVGGKAFGKSFAILNSEVIILRTAIVFFVIWKRTGIDLLAEKKRK